jgi:uncharacterized damage-inducible protein DinB
MDAMDLLDRLLGHDADMTRQVLLLCSTLADEQLDRDVDIGHRTLRETLAHMIGNVEIWTDLMAERKVDMTPQQKSVAALLDRHERSHSEFAELARKVQAEGRLDDTYTDTLDDPPTRKTFGGTIAHLITHDMLHRSEALHILQRLGVVNLPEGDVLGWESSHRSPPHR